MPDPSKYGPNRGFIERWIVKHLTSQGPIPDKQYGIHSSRSVADLSTVIAESVSRFKKEW